MRQRVTYRTENGIRRPGVPTDARSWRVIEDHGDGTVTVEIDRDDSDALRVAARLASDDKIKTDALTDDDVSKLSALYDPWTPGQDVAVGDLRSWDGTVVECIQAHTTQSDWQPDQVPALWKIHRTDSGGPIAWQAGITVEAGEQVTYEDVTYNVLQGHTTQVGWEPPSVPALFAPV